MLIKKNDADSLWIVCTKCGSAFRRGKSCSCGNIKTETNKSGVTKIVAEDTDAVVYDND